MAIELGDFESLDERFRLCDTTRDDIISSTTVEEYNGNMKILSNLYENAGDDEIGDIVRERITEFVTFIRRCNSGELTV